MEAVMGMRCILVALFFLVFPTALSAQTLIPAGSTTWEYQMLFGTGGGDLLIGSAPFAGDNCGVVPGTYWPPGWRIRASHHFGFTGTPTDATIRLWLQGQCELWINGFQFYSVTNLGDCPPPNPIVIPSNAGLWHEGDNVLTITGGNGNGPGFLDLQLTACCVTPTAKPSWGRLKVLYR